MCYLSRGIVRFIGVAIVIVACSCVGHPKMEESQQNTVGNTTDLTEIVNGAVGPFRSYTDGYGNPGATGLGYITVLTLETGIAPKRLDDVLDGIIAFDKAEATNTYIGQINMIKASSFNGLNGAIWGYDVAKADTVANSQIIVLFKKRLYDGTIAPVYALDPLLDAGRRLFGVRDQKRFPLVPGAHVVSAHKTHYVAGPATVWCGIAVAISRDRTQDATLFMEDCGHSEIEKNEERRQRFFRQLLENLAESINSIAQNQHTRYKEIFVGYKAEDVPEGYIGNALVAIPYVVLAKDAVPTKGAKQLLDITITEWEHDRNLPPLENK